MLWTTSGKARDLWGGWWQESCINMTVRSGLAEKWDVSTGLKQARESVWWRSVGESRREQGHVPSGTTGFYSAWNEEYSGYEQRCDANQHSKRNTRATGLRHRAVSWTPNVAKGVEKEEFSYTAGRSTDWLPSFRTARWANIPKYILFRDSYIWTRGERDRNVWYNTVCNGEKLEALTSVDRRMAK